MRFSPYFGAPRRAALKLKMVEVPPADFYGVLYYELSCRRNKNVHVNKAYRKGCLYKLHINSGALR